MKLLHSVWFPLLCLFILAVSLYDTFLIVEFQDLIGRTEKNPMGRWLIRIAGGEIGVFVRMKLAGTIVVLSVLVILQKMRSPRTLPVTTSVAAFQSGLLAYLTLA